MTTTAQLLLGLLAAAGVVLIWGGNRLRGSDWQKGWLMIACGIVMLGNVLIWLV